MTKARTLANLISDNAELADGQISVAEVVGAAPSANPTFTGTTTGTFSGPLTGNVTGNITGNVTGAVTGDVTAPEIDLTAIAKDIADTAVDVFVYDTSKDSDGGAWRHRTQHTSWYNETLNTSTRGSRKEFPAVAVIVAESTQVTIYDGDDPDLPMWMVFNQGGSIGSASNIISANASVTSLDCINGTMCFGTNDSSSPEGTFTVNFISELSRCYRTVGSGYTGSIYTGSVSTRNSNKSYEGDYDLLAIVSQNINDVAMTVLPNAPIDAATGLPVPTIAVATNGGVSVIKDDGTVVDITYVAHTLILNIHFNSLNHLMFTTGADGNQQNLKVHFSIPTSDQNNAQAGYQSSQEDLQYGNGYVTNDISVHPITHAFEGMEGDAIATNRKLVFIDKNNTDSNYITNFITSTYNTGYQVGDIKLATLSDTDDTDVTGSELVTNGTFDSNVNDWTGTSGGSIAYSSGRAQVTSTAYYGAVQAITVEVGKTYVLSFSAEAGTSAPRIRVGDASSGTKYVNNGLASALTDHSFTITATDNTTIRIFLSTGAASGTAFFDNVSLRLAEEDRSVNGNGLQVFGTVTKTAVATGADLVSYGGWSASNYLYQPYNADLNFGTGEYSVVFWFKQTSGTWAYVCTRGTADPAESMRIGMAANNIYFDYGSGSAYLQTNQSFPQNVWHCCVATVKAGEKGHLYLNGVEQSYLHQNVALASFPTATDYDLVIGQSHDALSPFLGELALLRVSGTVPTAEQIAKIYNDEKHLFQDGAQATLHGTSDAVTALAHDDSTDLLHVGTSAGRSVFQGLRRVSNTTDAVGAAISASNGLVAED